MSEAYAEPVNVRTRPDGRPTRFVWRDRLYIVRAILEHWVINREWWQDPDAEPGQPELEFWRGGAGPGPPPRHALIRLRPPPRLSHLSLDPPPLTSGGSAQELDVSRRGTLHRLP